MKQEFDPQWKPRLPLNWLDRLARRLVTQRLDGLRHGEVTLEDQIGSTDFGEPADLQSTIQIHEPRFFREALAGGSLSIAESYLRGDWDCADLTSLFRIFVRNMSIADQLDGGAARFVQVAQRMLHWWNRNSPAGSRRNIGAHYDLGNDFFRLWLDDTMAYSSGIFSSPSSTLREASVEKFDRVCRKLDLQRDDRVLEIGTGWGGFALHAAQNYGCHVTTTTISHEQFQFAQRRIHEAGLEDRITILEQDYRDLTGQFDKLASIEMIEAVGAEYMDTYFRQCGKLLRADGSMALQAIVMPERGYAQYLQNVDFIRRYVFPGGCLPSVASILESVGRTSDLRLVHVEEFALHYAETLRQWRKVFQEQLPAVRRLGYPEKVIRMWTYYLCYCEAVFEERHVSVLQMQFEKPQSRRSPVPFIKQADERSSEPRSTGTAKMRANSELAHSR